LDLYAQQIQDQLNRIKTSGSEDATSAKQIAALEMQLEKLRLDQQLENIETERKAALQAAEETGVSTAQINERYKAAGDLARASFQTNRSGLAASIQYKGPAEALIRGSQEEYNASMGARQPLEEMVAMAKQQLAIEEQHLKVAQEAAKKQPKVISAPA